VEADVGDRAVQWAKRFFRPGQGLLDDGGLAKVASHRP
jgi:hypothetical protein